MDIETKTENIVRRLSVVYHDVSEMFNRSSIKKWLSDLEKSVAKEGPDFVVLKGCCRYILFEIHRKEWCKYYFLSVPYAPNKPITRSHIVLSRYPLLRKDTFGSPTNHLVQLQIPFNDVPMRYEYEDLDVQQIDVQNIVLFVTDESSPDNPSHSQHAQTLQSSLQTVCSTQNPPTVILFGLCSDSALRPREWQLCTNNVTDIGDVNNVNNVTDVTEQSGAGGVCYLSQGWEFVEYTHRTKMLQFQMVNFD